MEKSKKISSIQGFRAITFLGVFLSHSGIDLGGLGALGVSIFLVLSGYLLVVNAHKKVLNPTNPIRYATDKMKDLYVLHIAVMFGFIVLKCVEAYLDKTVNIKLFGSAIIANIFLVQAYIPCYKVYSFLNGPSWYLCVVFLTYLAFPVVFKKVKNWHESRCIISIFILVAIQLMIALYGFKLSQIKTDNGSAQWLTYYFPPTRLIEFLIGCILGQIHETSKYTVARSKRLSSIIEGGIISITILAISMYQEKKGLFQYESLKYSMLMLPMAVAWLWIPIGSSGILNVLMKSKILVTLGNISGYCYLIHFLVIRWTLKVTRFLKLGINEYATIVFTFLVTIMLSICWIKLIKEKRHEKSNVSLWNKT